MPLRIPSLKLVRLWAALLLATIGLQATMPAAPSLDKRSGSAFSSSTYEVALAVTRTERAQRHAVAPQPLVPSALQVQAQPTAAALISVPAPRPASTGPPLRDIHSWQPAPRAPPIA